MEGAEESGVSASEKFVPVTHGGCVRWALPTPCDGDGAAALLVSGAFPTRPWHRHQHMAWVSVQTRKKHPKLQLELMKKCPKLETS